MSTDNGKNNCREVTRDQVIDGKTGKSVKTHWHPYAWQVRRMIEFCKKNNFIPGALGNQSQALRSRFMSDVWDSRAFDKEEMGALEDKVANWLKSHHDDMERLSDTTKYPDPRDLILPPALSQISSGHASSESLGESSEGHQESERHAEQQLPAGQLPTSTPGPATSTGDETVDEEKERVAQAMLAKVDASLAKITQSINKYQVS